MRIQEKDGLEIIEVFGIYWDSQGKTLFLGLTPEHTGQFAYSLDEVTILDHSINFKTKYLSNNLQGIYHWALIEKNLLDELIDCNLDSRELFLEILRSEKIIDW